MIPPPRHPDIPRRTLPELNTLAVERLAAVREAVRLHRLAQEQRRLWLFCLEQNLLKEAECVRANVLANLRQSRDHWRLTLAAAP